MLQIIILTEETCEDELRLVGQWLKTHKRTLPEGTFTISDFVAYIHAAMDDFTKLVSTKFADYILEINDEGLQQLKREILAQELQK